MSAVSPLSLVEFVENYTTPLLPNTAEYSSELLQNLNHLFNTQNLCDVGLMVQTERVIRAHRCVLSAASPYFHAMLTGGMQETRADVVDMRAVAAPHIIEKLIAFIYTGLFTTTCCLETLVFTCNHWSQKGGANNPDTRTTVIRRWTRMIKDQAIPRSLC